MEPIGSSSTSSNSFNGNHHRDTSMTPTIRASGLFPVPGTGRTIEIRDVWASNLEEEMENIREIITKYPYVAMVSSENPL
jgi:hypothetical protein